MAIRFFSDGPSFELEGKRKISQWLKQVVAAEGKQIGNLNYVFVSDERILEINRQFLQHDYYTDIITFDGSNGNIVAGEMYIGIDTVRSNAEDYQSNFREELLRVMVHGVLHLCGHDDQTEEKRQQMRITETKYLKFWS